MHKFGKPWPMISSILLNQVQKELVQQFNPILLDQEGNLYTYSNDIPVYLEGAGLNKVGIGQLSVKKKKLYAALFLRNHDGQDYSRLFPHLLHNIQGYIFAIFLSHTSPQDPTIKSLKEQLSND